MHRLTAEEEAPAARKGVQQQHRRRLPSSLSSSSRLPNDLVICATAYSHLSCFTRSTLLCLGCILVLLTTYEFAFDKGVREQMRDIGGEGGGVEMGSGNGIDEMRGYINSNKDDTEGHGISEDSTTTTDDEEGGGGGRQFTLEILHDTRTAAQSLLDMLDIYYGGRDQATNMLVHSWQAQWMLDDVASWTHDDLVVEGGRSLLDVDHDNNKEDCPICFLPMPLILICHFHLRLYPLRMQMRLTRNWQILLRVLFQ